MLPTFFSFTATASERTPGQGFLWWVRYLVPPPDDRTFTPTAEVRLFTPAAERRLWEIP
jgi:hypothetical protein